MKELTGKEKCKKRIKQLLRELENILKEAEVQNIEINDLNTDLIYKGVEPFAAALSSTGDYSSSTARDAINELLKEGVIEKSKRGIFELASSSKQFDKYCMSQVYATPLPVVGLSASVQYIEVKENYAAVLTDLFNRSFYKDDKRFYTVAPNLIMMLDLEIPASSSIVQKHTFNLDKFLKKHGIKVIPYDLIPKDIKGKTEEELTEEYFDAALAAYEDEQREQSQMSGSIINRSIPTKND